jgi:hypothetical protein
MKPLACTVYKWPSLVFIRQMPWYSLEVMIGEYLYTIGLFEPNILPL